MKKRTIALLMAVVMLFGATVGGTLAWLMDKDETVVNTFTVGDIDIELWEHQLNSDGKTLGESEVKTNEYAIIPGVEYPKDPFVRVKAGTEACWLFVTVTEANNAFGQEKYIDFGIDTAEWTLLETGVYYKDLTAKTAADTKYDILLNDKVSVNADIEKTEVAGLKTNKPSISFKAYAIQKEGFTSASAAWTQIKTEFSL